MFELASISWSSTVRIVAQVLTIATLLIKIYRQLEDEE